MEVEFGNEIQRIDEDINNLKNNNVVPTPANNKSKDNKNEIQELNNAMGEEFEAIRNEM